MAGTHIIRTHRTANQTTEWNERNSVYFLYCVHRFIDKARHWTNNEQRKVKTENASENIDKWK